MHYQVTTVGKFTCLFRCTWCSDWFWLATFRLRLDSHCRHLQATLSKLLTYCVLRPTQPSTLRGPKNEQWPTGYGVKS